MLTRIIISIVVGVITCLIVVLVAALLGGIFAPGTGLSAVAAFLQSFATLLGLLAGLWYFFAGETWFSRNRP